MYYQHTTYDAPTVVICSVAEMQATPSSAELQAYKYMGVSACYSILILWLLTSFKFQLSTFYREDYLYDSIIEGAAKSLENYEHNWMYVQSFAILCENTLVFIDSVIRFFLYFNMDIFFAHANL